MFTQGAVSQQVGCHLPQPGPPSFSTGAPTWASSGAPSVECIPTPSTGNPPLAGPRDVPSALLRSPAPPRGKARLRLKRATIITVLLAMLLALPVAALLMDVAGIDPTVRLLAGVALGFGFALIGLQFLQWLDAAPRRRA